MLLSIGAAQFGLNYGITNKDGKPSKEEIRKILQYAKENEISNIDTAQAYGNSEKVIGYCMSGEGYFDITTKLDLKRGRNITSKLTEEYLDSLFQKSVTNLQVKRLKRLLVHSSQDLSGINGGILYSWLKRMRTRGLIEEIGLSIYKMDEIEDLDINWIDFIQLPLSIYDQRAINNKGIERLHLLGKKIQARSIFLQGLLLTKKTQWPSWVQNRFKEHHQILCDKAEGMDITLMDLAVGFICSQDYLHSAVVGICNTRQLKEIHKSWKKNEKIKEMDWQSLQIRNEKLIDPRHWPKRK